MACAPGTLGVVDPGRRGGGADTGLGVGLVGIIRWLMSLSLLRRRPWGIGVTTQIVTYSRKRVPLAVTSAT